MRFAHANIKNKLHLFNEQMQVVEDFDLMKELFSSNYLFNRVNSRILFISLAQQNEKQTNISSLINK